MTTDKNRQIQIRTSLVSLKTTIDTLIDCVTDDILREQNTSECDIQTDLQHAFDNFLHRIGYDYDQRRW